MIQAADGQLSVGATNGSPSPDILTDDSNNDDSFMRHNRLLGQADISQINQRSTEKESRKCQKGIAIHAGIAYYTLLTIAILTMTSQLATVECANFVNGSDCFYAYMEGGNYSIANRDNPNEPFVGSFLSFELKDVKCFGESDLATLNITANLEQQNNADSLALDFQVKNWAKRGFWEITGVSVYFKLVPQGSVETNLIPEDTWAGQGYSYSCNKLDLYNLPTEKIPQVRITLRRFQIQPFKGGKTVFAESFDCAVWLTLPLIMGIALLLLFTFTVMILIYLMVELGNQTCDLKFCKQAGILMNQSQLENTKG